MNFGGFVTRDAESRTINVVRRAGVMAGGLPEMVGFFAVICAKAKPPGQAGRLGF